MPFLETYFEGMECIYELSFFEVIEYKALNTKYDNDGESYIGAKIIRNNKDQHLRCSFIYKNDEPKMIYSICIFLKLSELIYVS